MSELHFEDLAIGQTLNLRAYKMTKDEIISFAEQYDPQPFHLDEKAGAESVFGELVASGWHTTSVYIYLLTVTFFNETSLLAGKKMPKLVWPTPVRPGDVLTGKVQIVAKTSSDSHTNWGDVNYRVVGTNQNKDTVIQMDLKVFSSAARRRKVRKAEAQFNHVRATLTRLTDQADVNNNDANE